LAIKNPPYPVTASIKLGYWQPTAIIEYDEQLVRRLIEKVTVYEDKFIIEFKSGVTMDVNK
jgi:hypothetical protein